MTKRQAFVLCALLSTSIATLPLAVAVAEGGPGVMSQYLIEAKYADQAWSAMAQKPQNRIDLLRPVVERLGGKIESFWFSFGEYDAFVVVDLPDNVSAQALQIAGAAGNGFKVLKTTPLLTIAEAMEAMKKAGELRSSAAYGKARQELTPLEAPK